MKINNPIWIVSFRAKRGISSMARSRRSEWHRHRTARTKSPQRSGVGVGACVPRPNALSVKRGRVRRQRFSEQNYWNDHHAQVRHSAARRTDRETTLADSLHQFTLFHTIHFRGINCNARRNIPRSLASGYALPPRNLKVLRRKKGIQLSSLLARARIPMLDL